MTDHHQNCSCPLLQDILSQLQEIRALLQPKKCTPADLETLGRLLPAAGGLFGSSPFRTRELLADPAIRALVSGSPGSLGGLFSRAAGDGAIVAGLRLERVSREHGAVLWQVVRCLPEAVDIPLAGVLKSGTGG